MFVSIEADHAPDGYITKVNVDDAKRFQSMLGLFETTHRRVTKINTAADAMRVTLSVLLFDSIETTDRRMAKVSIDDASACTYVHPRTLLDKE